MAGRGNHPAGDASQKMTRTQLPALPQSAIRLLELSRDPTKSPLDFAAPIEADPGLTSQVLRFVNSSYFGFSQEISSVKLAIMLVGLRAIKNFALWNAVFSLIPNPRCGPFDLKCLWQDSLRRAMLARALGKVQGVSQIEDLFTASLLQDMAVPLLAKENTEAYVKLLADRDGRSARLSTLERETFGWTHAESAAAMARQWHLPEEFAMLIESHCEVDRWMGPARDPARLSVALSALLPSTVDPGWPECLQLESYYDQIAPQGSPSLLGLLEEIDHQFAAFAPVLKITNPRKSLVEVYHEAIVPAG